jgi:hypothetical protein
VGAVESAGVGRPLNLSVRREGALLSVDVVPQDMRRSR